jgi:hypothetical protein
MIEINLLQPHFVPYDVMKKLSTDAGKGGDGNNARKIDNFTGLRAKYLNLFGEFWESEVAIAIANYMLICIFIYI